MPIQKVDPTIRFVKVNLRDVQTQEISRTIECAVKTLKKETKATNPYGATLRGKQVFILGGYDFLLPYSWHLCVTTPEVLVEAKDGGLFLWLVKKA